MNGQKATGWPALTVWTLMPNPRGETRQVREQGDKYYTPFPIALRLAVYATSRVHTRIADLACGDGSLLAAAHQRWPRASLIANDTSAEAIRIVRRRCPLSSASTLDILRVAADTQLIRRLRRQWNPDLILLNPPFSARLRHKFSAAIGVDLRALVSQAAAFLLTSAQLLNFGGELIAVMPSSFLSSSRDRIARDLLRDLGDVAVVEELGRNAFKGCRAASVILTFRRKRPSPTPLSVVRNNATVQEGALALVTDVARGNVRVYESKVSRRKGRRRFLHTTNIRDGRAMPVLRQLPINARTVVGHAVLIPRVGTITTSKVITAYFRRAVVLSDCLFALKTATAQDAERLREAIVASWHLFQKEYVGTGAPHLRAEALLTALRGVNAYSNQRTLA